MISIFDCGIAIRHNVFNKGVPQQYLGDYPMPDLWAEKVGLTANDWVWIKGHTHNFNHLTLVIRGSFMVYARPANAPEDAPWRKRVMSSAPRSFPGHSFLPGSPAHMMIDKDVTHWLVSMEAGSEYACIYAARDEDGNQIPEHRQFIGWEENFG